jgi:hypothetical protein
MDLFDIAKRARAAVENDDAYLTSFMTQFATRADAYEWSVHFYDPLGDSMYTYDASTGEVRGPDEVLKQADFIPELDPNHVTVMIERALDAAYEAALPETAFVRVIVLLQVLDELETWNITFMNERFHSLNVRIDATSGRVIAKEPFELFGFDSGT